MNRGSFGIGKKERWTFSVLVKIQIVMYVVQVVEQLPLIPQRIGLQSE